jgi:hypothetical protein
MPEPLGYGQIWNALNNNKQFYDPCCYGPKGEPALTMEEKRKICGKITKDMKECLEANGPEFFAEIWDWIRKELGRANWFMRGYTGKQKDCLLGPWVIWRVVYKKASKLTEIIMKEKLPKTIHQAAKEAVKEVDEAMKKALDGSGALEMFE